MIHWFWDPPNALQFFLESILSLDFNSRWRCYPHTQTLTKKSAEEHLCVLQINASTAHCEHPCNSLQTFRIVWMIILGSSVCKSAVLNSSPRAPPALHISYVTLIASDVCSIRTQVPCEVDITGYSSMIPVRSERIYSIQSAYKCARRELKLYIFTYIQCPGRTPR